MRSKYIDTNNSFSGCDMVVSIGITLPNGQSYDRIMGAIQTLTYSIHMDKHPVRSIGNANAKDYVFGPRTIAGTLIFAVFNKHVAYDILDTLTKTHNLGKYHLMMDELPPFNITVSYANEYGVRARFALYGVRIINEGQTMSINDIYTENTYQFVATDIEYLSDATGGSRGSIFDEKVPYIGAKATKSLKPILTTKKQETKKQTAKASVKDQNLFIDFK